MAKRSRRRVAGSYRHRKASRKGKSVSLPAGAKEGRIGYQVGRDRSAAPGKQFVACANFGARASRCAVGSSPSKAIRAAVSAALGARSSSLAGLGGTRRRRRRSRR